MYFVRSNFGKMNIWPVEHFFEHICHHFWVGTTGATANPPKSDDKFVQKSVHLSEVTSYKIHTLDRIQDVWTQLFLGIARACQTRKQQNGSLWMSLQVHLCNQQWIIERLMMQITLLSLQFLLIIPTIEGRELFRISDDGLGGFRQEDSSREVTV